MNYATRIRRALGRRFGACSLQLLGLESRAEVVAAAAEGMTTTTAIPGGSIRFVASSPILLERAAGLSCCPMWETKY